jgi:hypothetical protein
MYVAVIIDKGLHHVHRSQRDVSAARDLAGSPGIRNEVLLTQLAKFVVLNSAGTEILRYHDTGIRLR